MGRTDDRRSRVFARGYSVFNAAQVDGYAAPALPVLPDAERIGHAEAFFAATGIDSAAWRRPRLLPAQRGPGADAGLPGVPGCGGLLRHPGA